MEGHYEPCPWPRDRVPTAYIYDYNGPYPIKELQSARQTLINCLKYPQFDVIERAKPKFGLSSKYGPGVAPPPVDVEAHKQQQRALDAAVEARQHQQPTTTTYHQLDMSADSSMCSTDSGYTSGHVNVPHRGSNFGSYGRTNLVNLTPTRPEKNNAPWISERNDTPGNSASSEMMTPASTPSSAAALSFNTNDPNPDASYRSISPILELAAEVDKAPRSTTPNFPPRKRSLDSPVFDDTLPTKRLKLPSPGVENTSEVLQIFKCDFCSFVSDTEDEMQGHLVDAKHFAGSLYKASKATGKLEFLSIDKMLAVKNTHSKASALVVTCSECHDVFEDIFMCGVHYQYMHGGDVGLYSICPIIHHQTAAISVNLDCLVCKKPNAKPRDLFKHWESYPSHLPASKPSHHKVFSLFICPYCHKTFHQDYDADNRMLQNCHSHVLNHRFDETHSSKQVFAIEVKHIMQTQRTEKLPPFNSGVDADGNYPGLEDELSILRNTKRHFQAMGSSKHKLQTINTRLTLLLQQAKEAGVRPSFVS